MRPNVWTNAELITAARMRGGGATWKQVAAALPGRSANACAVAYHDKLGGGARPDLVARAQLVAYAGRPAAAPAPDRPAPPVSGPEMPRGRSIAPVPTARLVNDAELRARIAVLGITGGLLGDPVPGRSALDQKRGGAA